MNFFFRNKNEGVKNKDLTEKVKQIVYNLVWESIISYTKPYDVTLPKNTQN